MLKTRIMNLPITAFDILVILTVLVSAGYAAWKGFLSETLTIFDWLAAAFGCLYFGPYLVPMARGFISTGWIAALVAYALVFLAIFIPLSFMSHRFSESVKNSPIGPLNRALGIAFGVVRGLVVAGLAYLGYSYFVSVPTQPAWVKTARTLPMVQATDEEMLRLVPSQSRHIFAASPDSPSPRQDDAIGNLIRQDSAAAPAPAPSSDIPPEPREKPQNPAQTSPAKKAAKGYGASDRRALDTLLQNGGENR
jgi:membrane protein required for colicin V production